MIEVKTRYDASITKPLFRLYIRRMLWFFILFSINFSVPGFMVLIFSESDFEVLFGIIIVFIGFGIGLIYIALIYCIVASYQIKVNKSIKIMTPETSHYLRFEENVMLQELRLCDAYRATSELNYKLLYKVYETKSHFFLFIAFNQPFVVPKRDIITGSPQGLSNIFCANLGKKFKVYNIK